MKNRVRATSTVVSVYICSTLCHRIITNSGRLSSFEAQLRLHKTNVAGDAWDGGAERAARRIGKGALRFPSLKPIACWAVFACSHRGLPCSKGVRTFALPASSTWCSSSAGIRRFLGKDVYDGETKEFPPDT